MEEKNEVEEDVDHFGQSSLDFHLFHEFEIVPAQAPDLSELEQPKQSIESRQSAEF